MEANPAGWIGRRMLIECQLRFKDGSPRHPMAREWVVDHPLAVGEVVG
jgi:hypothetical protein